MKDETTIMQNWDFPDETVSLPPITTNQVAQNTINICPTCGIHNYLVSGKCARCDYHFV